MYRHSLGFLVLEPNEEVPDPTQLQDFDDLFALSDHISAAMLIDAYSKGVFPWNDASTPNLWFCPKERMIITPESLKIPKSMKSILRGNRFQITYNQKFESVITNCAQGKGREDTWIHPRLKEIFIEAHLLGKAWSVESWLDHTLVGGLFGMHCGSFFSGDSMFAHSTNASKAAFLSFAVNQFDQNLKFIDCQVPSAHLASLGGFVIGRKEFLLKINHKKAP